MYNEYPDDASTTTTHEQRSAAHSTDSFWYQDFQVSTLTSSRMHDGMLFYHGMGTGKTCLYTKYIASVLQQGRRYTNIHIVTKRVLRDSVIEAFRMPACNQGVDVLGARNRRGVHFQTYNQFIGRRHVHGESSRRTVAPISVHMSLVVIDEAHKILEKSKTTSTKGGDIMFVRFMELARTHPSATFLLFTGTPFNTHEVDIVNLARIASRAFNAFLREFFPNAVDSDLKITPAEFTHVMSHAESSRRVMEQLGRALSYIQLPPANIPPRIMRESADATFSIRTDSKTLTHRDLGAFGPFYVSCMTKEHQAQYESRIRPSVGMERSVIRMVDTCSLDCRSAADGAVAPTPEGATTSGRTLTYDLRNRPAGGDDHDPADAEMSSSKRLLTYEHEFIHLASNHGVPGFLQALRAHGTFSRRLAYLKRFCPIMGAVVEHLFEAESPHRPRRQMCMIYSHYAHMLDVRSDPGNTLRGIVPFILNAFGFGLYDPSNAEYMSYLFLHKRASYGRLGVVNSDDNWDGALIRVLLVSPKFSEGISISNLQQIHILAPDYGLFSKTDQAIARGFRSNGHRKVKAMLGDAFDGVHVFMHLCLSAGRQFPARLYYYLRMMYMDVRIKAFERYCMTYAYDCSFMQRINKRSIAENFTRACQYMLCDYACEMQRPSVLIDDSAYYPSFYEHYRPFVQSIEGHIARAMHRGDAFSVSGESAFHRSVITNYGLPERVAEAIYRDTVAQFARRKPLILSIHGEYVFPVHLDDQLIPFPARFAFLRRDAATCLQHAMRPPVWYLPGVESRSVSADAPRQLGAVQAPSESLVVLKPRKPKSKRFVFTEISRDCLDRDVQFLDAHRRCVRRCFEDQSYWYLLRTGVRDESATPNVAVTYQYKEKSFRDLLVEHARPLPSKLHSESSRMFINASLALCFKYLRRDVLERRPAVSGPEPPDDDAIRRAVVDKALAHADRYTNNISRHPGFRSMAYILMIHVGDASVRRHLFYKVFAHFWYLGFQTKNNDAMFIGINQAVASQYLYNSKLRPPPTPLLHLLYSLLDDFFGTPGNEAEGELACGAVLLESSVGTYSERLGVKDQSTHCVVRILHHINRFFLRKYVEAIDAHLLPACLAVLDQTDQFAWVRSDPMPTVRFIDEEVARYVNAQQPNEALFRNLFYDSYLLLRVLPGTIFKVGKDLLENSTRIRDIYAEIGAPTNVAGTLAALERVAEERGLLIRTEHSPFQPLPQVEWACDAHSPGAVEEEPVVDDAGRGRGRGRGRGSGRGSGRASSVTDDGVVVSPTDSAFADDLFDELVAEGRPTSTVAVDADDSEEDEDSDSSAD